MVMNESYNVYQVSKDDSACPRIIVDILGSQIEVGIDTQSSINAISKETFEKMKESLDSNKNTLNKN